MSHPMIENYLPLVRNKATVAGQMGWVLIALLPGIGVSAWFYGLSSLVNLALCSATALLAEALFVWMRSRPILQTLSDGSALVTAWLISLSMLPISPWWVVVFITVFGLSIKHLYGGLGQNPFNPAMAAICFLLMAFPSAANNWTAMLHMTDSPDKQMEAIFGRSVDDRKRATFSTEGYMASSASASPRTHDPKNARKGSQKTDAQSGATPHMDAIAMATPLSLINPAQLVSDLAKDLVRPYYVKKMLMTHASLWLSIAFLMGGSLLLIKRVISWRLPTAFLVGLGSVSTLFWLVNPGFYAPPQLHLLAGGTMLGAFFIITDPVSGVSTPKGQLIYAFLIGLLVYLIRALSSYPDGVALAVLAMNLFAPLIERLTPIQPFGANQHG